MSYFKHHSVSLPLVCVIFFLLFLLQSSYSVAEPAFRVGLSIKPTSVDPHLEPLEPNLQLARHLFDNPLTIDKEGKFTPGIITHYKKTSDTSWILSLKKGVKFHDLTELTAKNIAYTLKRMRTIHPNSAITQYKTLIKNIDVLGQYRLRLNLSVPVTEETILSLLGSSFAILKTHTTTKPSYSHKTKETFVGTGPYKLIHSTFNGTLRLKAFEYYHDKRKQHHIKEATLHFFDNKKQRFQAFINNQLDLIDHVSVEEYKTLQAMKTFRINQQSDDRLMFLFLDSGRDRSPFVKSYKGQDLNTNPLKQKNVRKALSISINRKALASSLFSDQIELAEQLVRPGKLGYSRALSPIEYNPTMARQLLRDAGYSHGFSLTLHGPNDRYYKELELLEAIADMWRAIGIKVTVNTMKKNQYFQLVKQRTFSTGLMGFSKYGHLQSMLIDLLLTETPEQKYGSWNAGNYRNDQLNQLVLKAMKAPAKTMNLRFLRYANEIAMQDYALIPLYFPKLTWATRLDMAYWPDNSGHTLLWRVKPVK